MEITETKLHILKTFLKRYEQRKIQDKLLLNVLREVVVEYESAYITIEMNKKNKKGKK
jgi:hypothetical protein